MISFDPGEDVRAFAQAVHDFAAEQVRPVLRELEHEGAVPPALADAWRALGTSGVPFPEEVGGLGMDLRATLVLAEEIAWGDIGAAVALPGIDAAGQALLLLGDKDQRARLIPAHLDSVCTLAILEPLPAFDLPDTFTFAEQVEGGYRLWGRKAFVLHGGQADLTVVVATLDPELSLSGLRAFVVEGRPAELVAGEPERLLGLETARYAEISLEGVFVPEANVLEGEGEFIPRLYDLLSRLRLITGARVVGACRAALEYATKYACERVAFGKPIVEHQAVSFMLAEMATEVDQARWQLWRAAWSVDTGSPSATRDAALAWHKVVEMSQQVTSRAVQVLGGHGFIQDHPVEKWMRDVRVAAIVSGLDGFVVQDIAESIVTG